MFTIDQNCHSLWDVVPKLQALSARGLSVRHFIEDVDAAFTALGSSPDQSDLLRSPSRSSSRPGGHRLARERFYRGGGSDWGAAMFYSEFLGRLPVEIRRWEEFTGLKTAVLARQLGRSVDDLYDEYSPGDNWQLIGSSYVADQRHHRIIADLTVSETAPFLVELFEKARGNMQAAFPQEASRRRLTDWFTDERHRLDQMIAQWPHGRLAELYHAWLRQCVGGQVQIDFLSNLLPARDGSAGAEMLRVFCQRYQEAATLYNQALEETGSDLRPLDMHNGELPFFATTEHHGHLVRTGVLLTGRTVRIDDREFKVALDGSVSMRELTSAGVRCLVGKAVLLAIQVRLGEQGQPLALPYRGSLYMPAAARLAGKLSAANMLPGKLQPLLRVRFRLLDRLKDLDTVIVLPEHLHGYFGGSEIPARRLGEEYAAVASQAAAGLEAFRTPQGRRRWQEENFPGLLQEMAELDRRRRQLAKIDPKSPEIRDVWKRMKAIQVRLLDQALRRIARDWQARDIDYWDSRGALLPWSIALGGREFYGDLIARAEVYEEPGIVK